MPNVAFPNTAKVVCHQSFFGDESVNSWSVLLDTLAVVPAVAPAIAAAFEDFYTNLFSATPGGINSIRPNFAVFDQIRVYDWRTVPNPPPVEFNYSVAGNITTNMTTPLDTACVITLLTANGTRRGRGRVFIGPTAQLIGTGTVNIPPMFDDASIESIADAVVDLDAALVAITDVDGLGVTSVLDGVTRRLTGLRIDGRPDTQRRRDLSVGFAAIATRTL